MQEFSKLSSEKIVTYPSPFFDLSNKNMPIDTDELLDWCIYYYLATPLIPAVINKLSTYPITDIIIESEEKENKQKWDSLLNRRLNVKYKMFENNLDYFLMGASYSSLYIPFTRQLICEHCGFATPIKGADWRVAFKKRKKSDDHNMPEFTFKCPVCERVRIAKIKDTELMDWAGINVVRYAPRDIRPIRDPISGRCKYLWTIPERYKQIIKSGRHPDFIEKCPAEVLEAINGDGKLLLSDRNIYEMRRPSIAGDMAERGTPIVIHALKWTYYMAQLQSAQEAIAAEKIIPFDILFPTGGGGSSTAPSQAIGWNKFVKQLQDGLELKRKDPGYKLIMPTAVGNVRLGGDGRALMLAAEIDWVSKQIISSMGVPLEFVYGGLTWTGSSITLRMLENTMIGVRDNSELWLQWIVNKIASVFKITAPNVHMSELKMADDVQRQQILMNLEATEKIATSTLLDELGKDFHKESDKILAEAETKAKLIINSAITSAKAQGTAALIQNDFMMRSQLIQNTQSASSGLDPATGYPTDQNGTPIDPNTGFPIDPQIGLPVNPETGGYINPESGQEMTPEETQQYAMQQQSQQAQQQNTQNAPTQGNQGMPGSAVDNAILSQQEQKETANESAAQQAGSYNAAPANIKQTVTSLAQQLLGSDLFTRQSVLQNLAARSPALAQMTQERMGMLAGGMQ